MSELCINCLVFGVYIRRIFGYNMFVNIVQKVMALIKII